MYGELTLPIYVTALTQAITFSLHPREQENPASAKGSETAGGANS